MKKSQRDKHEFAIFTHEVDRLIKVNQTYALAEKDLVHRLGAIIRVDVGDSLVLFNTTDHVTCEVVAVTKKEVMVKLGDRTSNKGVAPHIIWCLPVLEREGLEEALAVLTAMGATEIYPIITEKSRQQWGNEKDHERAQRIMIAAGEQSKQFVLPRLHATQRLPQALANLHGTKIFFDALGGDAYEMITQCKASNAAPFIFLIGPEGDLTAAEKKMVAEDGFVACCLTPTILRAYHAVTVGMGLVRSLL